MRGRSYVDGGRSRLVQKSLTPLVDEVRLRLKLDVGLVLYRSAGSPDAYVLASSGEPGIEMPLANEPVTVPVALRRRIPGSLRQIAIESAIRAYRLPLAATIVLPWDDEGGRGWFVAGLTDSRANLMQLEPELLAELTARLRDVHRVAAFKSSARLRENVQAVVRSISEAEIAASSSHEALQAILFAARALLGTSAAYISMPEVDGGAFRFTNFLNIRTGAFRDLEMGPGAGLGGLTREVLRAVRTLNYAADDRLRQAPVEVSLREGLLSAMCAPLVAADGTLLGLLYAANRRLTPFTESDTDLLDEFAGFASLSLQRVEAEKHRMSVMRRLEQERLAFDLHDSLVRDLMEIGFTAEAGLAVSGESHVRSRLEAIGRTAELCLEKVREEITRMANNGGLAEHASLGEVIEALRCMHSRGCIERSFVVSGSHRSKLPPSVATTLVVIGQEALENAERHSRAANVEVVVKIGRDFASIRVSDDGHGMSDELLESVIGERSPQLGLRRMRSATRRLNGSFSIGRPEGGGLTIEARIPFGNEAAE